MNNKGLESKEIAVRIGVIRGKSTRADFCNLWPSYLLKLIPIF